MEKRLLFLGLMAILFSVVACDNEVDLTADWVDLPIVYGLINEQDTVHYIRVEKAFQDQNGDAFLAAQTFDSLYYDESLVVSVENLTTGDIVNFERVNGEDYGFFREEGDFVVSPNILYRAEAADIPMEGSQRLKLILDRPGDNDLVTAETVVIGEIIPQGNISAGKDVDFPTDRDVTFRWRSPLDAKIFDLNFYFNYAEESLANPGEFEFKTAVWEAGKGIEASGGEQTAYKIFGLDFYSFLASAIPNDPNINRFFIGVDAEVVGGGSEIEQFISITLANTGITSSQELPVFTNLSEGRGLFTSIAKGFTPGLGLTQGTIDSLRAGSITGNLNFQ